MIDCSMAGPDFCLTALFIMMLECTLSLFLWCSATCSWRNVKESKHFLWYVEEWQNFIPSEVSNGSAGYRL